MYKTKKHLLIAFSSVLHLNPVRLILKKMAGIFLEVLKVTALVGVVFSGPTSFGSFGIGQSNEKEYYLGAKNAVY